MQKTEHLLMSVAPDTTPHPPPPRPRRPSTQPKAAPGQDVSVERARWECWPTKNTRQAASGAGPGATERVPRPEVVRDAACSGGDDQDQRVDAQSFGKTEGVDGTGLGDRREG